MNPPGGLSGGGVVALGSGKLGGMYGGGGEYLLLLLLFILSRPGGFVIRTNWFSSLGSFGPNSQQGTTRCPDGAISP